LKLTWVKPQFIKPPENGGFSIFANKLLMSLFNCPTIFCALTHIDIAGMEADLPPPLVIKLNCGRKVLK